MSSNTKHRERIDGIFLFFNAWVIFIGIFLFAFCHGRVALEIASVGEGF
jgi:hypothetical protein